VSFPKVWSESTLDALNVDPVLASPQPAPSGDYKVVARDGAVQDSNGNWVYAWTEQDMFTEYEDNEGKTVTVQEQIDAYESTKLVKKRQSLVVTMRQARLALSQVNKLSLVNEAIEEMQEPDKTTISIEWEYGSTVERVSPWIDIMSTALGMTGEEMDDLFELAVTL
jgi:hypothetical protein